MNFKHVYPFLVLSGIIYWEIYSKQLLLPWGIFAFCSHGEKLPWQGRLPGVVQWVMSPPLEVAQGQGDIHVNSYRCQTMHRGKVDPGVSDLPEAMSCPCIM